MSYFKKSEYFSQYRCASSFEQFIYANLLFSIKVEIVQNCVFWLSFPRLFVVLLTKLVKIWRKTDKQVDNLIPASLCPLLTWLKNFQHSLFLEITTLITWLRSTLLLKNKFIWKHNVYKQIRCSILWKEKRLRSWVCKEKRVALIKSLIDTW